MDNLSNKRIRKNGRDDRIFNCLSVGVSWDNGSQTRERLDSLEFIEDESVKAEYVIPKTTA